MCKPIHTTQHGKCCKNYACILCFRVSDRAQTRKVAYDLLMLATLIGIAAGKSKKTVSIIAAITTTAFATQPS